MRRSWHTSKVGNQQQTGIEYEDKNEAVMEPILYTKMVICNIVDALCLKIVTYNFNEREAIQNDIFLLFIYSMLKKIGVRFESYNKIRQEQLSVLGGYLRSEMMTFDAWNTNQQDGKAKIVEIQAPIAYIHDLQSFIFNRLDSMER